MYSSPLTEEDPMVRCECCGNKYNLDITVEKNGIRHYFDCFECAIHRLAPYCERCNVRVIGCAREARKTALQYEPNTSEDNMDSDFGKGPNRDQPQLCIVTPGPV